MHNEISIPDTLSIVVISFHPTMGTCHFDDTEKKKADLFLSTALSLVEVVGQSGKNTGLVSEVMGCLIIQ